MADIVYTDLYSKKPETREGAIGRLKTPIKMIIEHESDVLTKKGGIRDWLFNVEKSNKFGETIIGSNEFDVFQAAAEGAAAAKDNMQETYHKFIEHIQFMKQFTITAEMMEDANYGVAADARRRAENFVRAYYKTQHRICQHVLAEATDAETTFAGAKINLTTGDDLPLFSTAHKYGIDTGKEGAQSNLFSEFGSSGTENRLFGSTGNFEENLNELANKLRNMKDENGDALGYTADTIILPGNRPSAEAIAKKVCGSEGALGNGYNDINLQYGNWNIVVMPDWQTEKDAVMIMSSEANKNLGGNMFFNRIPLTINDWIDEPTSNYNWVGRCRFGVGFGTYKHILLAKEA